MHHATPLETLGQGKFLRLVRDGCWEYVTRTTARAGVGVVAVTPEGQVVLVRQHRVPVGGDVVELPAGLVGDTDGARDEPALEAARRELLEETGYVSDDWTELGVGYSSPGQSDEAVVLCLARGVRRVGPGGGVDGEAITTLLAPLDGLVEWLAERRLAYDIKLLAGVLLAQRALGR